MPAWTLLTSPGVVCVSAPSIVSYTQIPGFIFFGGDACVDFAYALACGVDTRPPITILLLVSRG